MTSRTSLALWTIGVLFSVAACAPEKAPADTPTRTVVLISIDTLRPERLGVYGNSPDVSPAIDALARDGVVFEQSLAVAPWTLPSHMTMLTGLDPVMHGVRTPTKKLPERVNTLAEILGARGYRTAAFADGGFVGTGYGFEQGFETFDSAHGNSPDETGFKRYLQRAFDWTRSVGEQPYFLFLHSFDSHAPYQNGDPEILARFRSRPTPEGPDDHQLYRGSFTYYARNVKLDQYGRMSEVFNDYDAGVHESDRAVQAVVDLLREQGRYDDALIIVTSDHGESFYDHGLWIGHGIRLTDDEIRTPLIVKLPRNERAGTREKGLVDQVDLAPTVLDAALAPLDEWMRGTSVRKIVRGEKRARSYSFGGSYATESHFLVRNDLKYTAQKSIPPINTISEHLEPSTPDCIGNFVRGTEKRVDDGAGGVRLSSYSYELDPLGLLDALPFHERLFDRKADPKERGDVTQQRPADVEAMRKALAALILESQRIHGQLDEGGSNRDLSINEIRKLQSLGYAIGTENVATDLQVDETIERLRAQGRRELLDMERLTDVDRRLHRIRLAQRESRELGDLSAELIACADQVVAWLEENHERRFLVRALWRIHEAAALAQRASVEFSIPLYTNRLHEAVGPAKPAADPKDASKDSSRDDSSDSRPGPAGSAPPSKASGTTPNERPS